MKQGTKVIRMVCLALLAVLCIQILAPAETGLMSSAQAASKIKLDKTKASVEAGETVQLTLKGTKKKVKWSSSDKSVAKVSSKGLVKAKKAGTAVITAKCGGKEYTCGVTVLPVLSVNKTELTMEPGKSARVKILCRKAGSFAWKSDNADVAVCQWSGKWDGKKLYLKVKAVGPGTATITVSHSKTKEKPKIRVTVNEKAEITEAAVIN